MAAKPKTKATPKSAAPKTNKPTPKPEPKKAAAKVAPKKPEAKRPEPKKAEPKKVEAKSMPAAKPAASKPAAATAKPAPSPAKPPAAKTAAPAKAPESAAPLAERRSKMPPKLTVRAPVGADELKAKIGALATATAQIRALKRTLSRSFMDVGLILVDIRDKRLYEAKGYGSFEAFLEREIELGKTASLRLARAVELFQRPAAVAGGMDKVLAAVAAFDGDAADNQGAPPTSSGGLRSPIPFHKR
ncbi:MAG: hypothetical protein J0L92_34235 [Deltaproteobacteria bacterium]|nr:hypothetical protein [Deltaproteobacteria bacterium]